MASNGFKAIVTQMKCRSVGIFGRYAGCYNRVVLSPAICRPGLFGSD